MLQIKDILHKLSYELNVFISHSNLSKDSLALLFEISIEELDLLVRAELDLKLSKLIEIALKIGKIPKLHFVKDEFS